ncbi:MAG: sulfate ABC transporter permease subunit [Armatimonadetes bacterium]|nr:sulfate ABC transporter permease subunit [Anaerolineae bacterium]
MLSRLQNFNVRSLFAPRTLVIGAAYSTTAVLLLAPMVAIVSSALAEGIVPLVQAILTPEALLALRLSFLLGITAAVINTVLGVIIAWVLVRQKFPGRQLFNALVDLPFVVSPVIVGYVMIVLFGRGGWVQDFPIPLAFSWQAMLVVTVFVCLPFVIREVQPVLASMTREQEHAAYTLGATRWLTFWRIVFPGLRHAITYGVILTLARAIGEFGAVAIIGGGVQGVTETATIYVYRSLHDRNEIGAYSMAITLAITAIVILTVMNWLRHRTTQTGSGHVNHA